MPIKRRIGYDIYTLYSPIELESMYLKEGMEKTQAHKKAQEIYRVLNAMRTAERRLWNKVRENEIPSGLEPEGMEDEYAASEGIK